MAVEVMRYILGQCSIAIQIRHLKSDHEGDIWLCLGFRVTHTDHSEVRNSFWNLRIKTFNANSSLRISGRTRCASTMRVLALTFICVPDTNSFHSLFTYDSISLIFQKLNPAFKRIHSDGRSVGCYPGNHEICQWRCFWISTVIHPFTIVMRWVRVWHKQYRTCNAMPVQW